MMCKKKDGFTLIELLVVISIIALLVSILMPALSKARRQARIVVCSTNLYSIAIGMNTYATDNEGKYMPRWAGYPRLQFYPGMAYDTRQMLLDYVAFNTKNLLFCPAVQVTGKDRGQIPGIDRSVDPSAYSGEDYTKWSKFFWVSAAGYGMPKVYLIGYHVYGGMRGDPGYYGITWDWTLSGNRNRDMEPRVASDAQDCIVADVQEAWPAEHYGGTWGLPGQPFRSNHSRPFESSAPGVTVVDIKFESSNAAYGDGHVERHNTLKYGVQRVGADGGLFEY